MPAWAGWLLFVPVVVWGSIAFIAYMSVRTMSSPSFRLQPAAGAEASAHADEIMGLDAWAQPLGFEWVGSFTMNAGSMRSFIAGWQHRQQPTFLAVYYITSQQGGKAVTKRSYDFVTEFSPDIGLTTGTTRDAQFFPARPGAYRQSFSGLDPDDVWAWHQASQEYLMRVGGIRMDPPRRGFEDAFHEGIQKQMAFVRSIPLWPLRAPFWYFVNRRRYHNMSVEQQHRARLIRMPHEFV